MNEVLPDPRNEGNIPATTFEIDPIGGSIQSVSQNLNLLPHSPPPYKFYYVLISDTHKLNIFKSKCQLLTLFVQLQPCFSAVQTLAPDCDNHYTTTVRTLHLVEVEWTIQYSTLLTTIGGQSVGVGGAAAPHIRIKRVY